MEDAARTKPTVEKTDPKAIDFILALKTMGADHKGALLCVMTGMELQAALDKCEKQPCV